MRNTVLDASAVLALLFDEPGAEIVEALLHRAVEADKPLLMTAANWAEVLSFLQRKRGHEGTAAAKNLQETMPLCIAPVDMPLAEAAAQLQAEYGFGLPRAFAVALSKAKKADLVTSDQSLKLLEKVIRISWIAEKT
jgi:ribonuclease VapC